ncbi:MAG: ATPase [Elusimicrobia bacterium CG08_land_8_20_14_0_20_59_10]|nr:MAG: ATPase [Elusimicrobia bacterium CG08_land_8_20_14_0_20_59_10]
METTADSAGIKDWHKKTVEETLKGLGSGPAGLSPGEAALRADKYGPNSLKEKPKRAATTIFFNQFKDFMIAVLAVAAVVSGVIGEMLDAAVIAAIIFLNAVMGFIQEYRAQKAMEALKKMSAPEAAVIRAGAAASVPSGSLVPGDIVLLEAGSVVPADLRLIEAASLKTEEAALTGESLSVEKSADAVPGEELPLGERRNMAYSGTTVSYGRGKGAVTATGMDTELGKIAGMLQDEEEVQTPLQKRLTLFGKKLSWTVLAVCAAVFGLGLLRDEPPAIIFLTAVSLAVAAIPEALPAVISIALAMGAGKMVKQNALIRKLLAVETLGSVTYICSDKTGTLTQNKMTVEEVYLDGTALKAGEKPDRPDLYARLLTGFALNNDSLHKDGGWAGDPTETALCSLAEAGGFDKQKLDTGHPRAAELPFDSKRKRMTTFHAGRLSGWEGGAYFSLTKGAAEGLLENTAQIMTSSGLSPDGKEKIRAAIEDMAARGLRVLGLAARQWDALPATPAQAEAEKDLVFIGLAGIADPPREEAKAAVAQCRAAGIMTVMITGDHPVTANNISGRLGIITPGAAGVMLTGAELARLSPEDFALKVEQVRVYARVAPEQKLRIVKALQARGHFVAMTGDGVNDAPALKRANIGIAMGITGTDVSKEAAHMILLDDNFATIVKAVGEGRRIFDNIKRFVRYILAGNSGEIWTIVLAPFFGLPIPLLPIQILWINLVTDGLPGLALAAEPAEPDIMNRPPRKPEESFFAGGLGVYVIWVGLVIGGLCLGAQAWAIKTGAHWQTIVLTVLCLSQLSHALAVRSERRSFFQMGAFSNKPMLYSVIATIALQMTVIYAPWFNKIFHTSPLPPGELLLALALSSVVFFAVEAEKLIKRRGLTETAAVPGPAK